MAIAKQFRAQRDSAIHVGLSLRVQSATLIGKAQALQVLKRLHADDGRIGSFRAVHDRQRLYQQRLSHIIALGRHMDVGNLSDEIGTLGIAGGQFAVSRLQRARRKRQRIVKAVLEPEQLRHALLRDRDFQAVGPVCLLVDGDGTFTQFFGVRKAALGGICGCHGLHLGHDVGVVGAVDRLQFGQDLFG